MTTQELLNVYKAAYKEAADMAGSYVTRPPVPTKPHPPVPAKPIAPEAQAAMDKWNNFKGFWKQGVRDYREAQRQKVLRAGNNLENFAEFWKSALRGRPYEPIPFDPKGLTFSERMNARKQWEKDFPLEVQRQILRDRGRIGRE